MVEFFFKYYLLFPKIPLSPMWGILLGEIFLLFYLPYYLFTRKKIRVPSLMFVYYAFVIWHIFISSMLSAAIVGFLPTHSSLYIFRMALYVGLFFIAFEQYDRYQLNADIVKKIYNRPFVIQFWFGALIVAVYYATHSPTTSDIMWVYEVGLRMIPNAALHIDFDSFFFLKAVQGAGNLLAGWALAILILNKNQPSLSRSTGIVWIAVGTVLLTLSRGGFLTVMLYLVYLRVMRRDYKVSYKLVAGSAVLLVGAIIYFFVAREKPLPNIFARLDITFSGNTFDSSSLSRFSNYATHMKTWLSQWYYVFIGYGFDKKGMELLTGLTVVESLFLSVLVGSGIIGFFLMTILYLSMYLKRVRNYWYRCLWEFIFFESILMWTITGGDFFAPHAAYIMMTFIGFGFAEQVKGSKVDSPVFVRRI